MNKFGYIDQNGITIPQFEDVYNALVTQYKSIYGEDVYLEPDSKDGQWVGIIAKAIHDTYLTLLDVYNSFSPITAQGTGLDNIVALNGITRDTATASTVDVIITGQAGTVINNGKVQDTQNNLEWILPPAVEIPVSGQVIVTATCSQLGNVRTLPHTVTVIVTPVRGWKAVDNQSAANAGVAIETDFELRQKQMISTAIPSHSIFEGILGSIAALHGVNRLRGYENDTNVMQTWTGLPPHSVCFVVEGGDAFEIASVIRAKKTPGAYTHGDQVYETEDRYGTPLQIRFFRPNQRNIQLTIRLAVVNGFVNLTMDTIKQRVTEYVNTFAIGEIFYMNRLTSIINACEPDPKVITFDIAMVQYSLDGGLTWQSTNIELGFTDMLVCTSVDVGVVV